MSNGLLAFILYREQRRREEMLRGTDQSQSAGAGAGLLIFVGFIVFTIFSMLGVVTKSFSYIFNTFGFIQGLLLILFVMLFLGIGIAMIFYMRNQLADFCECMPIFILLTVGLGIVFALIPAIIVEVVTSDFLLAYLFLIVLSFIVGVFISSNLLFEGGKWRIILIPLAILAIIQTGVYAHNIVTNFGENALGGYIWSIIFYSFLGFMIRVI